MFGRKKETEYRFIFDIEEVIQYFETNNYIGTKYKKNESKQSQDRLQKEINRYMEQMEWIKGYESIGTHYVIYHGNSTRWTALLFSKLKELAEKTARSNGCYSKANKDIENFVIRDEEDMTFYMLRVGADIITTCVPRMQEEEMRTVFTSLNNYVYKRAL